MLRALRAKFSTNSQLRSLLLSTGQRVLIEHTSNDDYWGDGGDGHGRNRLGALLMTVREELRSGAPPSRPLGGARTSLTTPAPPPAMHGADSPFHRGQVAGSGWRQFQVPFVGPADGGHPQRSSTRPGSSRPTDYASTDSPLLSVWLSDFRSVNDSARL